MTNDSDLRLKSASAETLRLILPKMNRYAQAYTPGSYALWFAYVEARTPALNYRVDELLKTHSRLTAATTEALLDEFVRTPSERAMARAKVQIVALLRGLQTLDSNLSVDNANYLQSVEQLDQALSGAETIEAIQKELVQMAAAVSAIRGSAIKAGTQMASNQQDIELLSAELARLRNDALTDPLSGLANRRGFDRSIEALQVDLASGGPAYSVALIDLDHFKQINDSHGHLTGDRVIQAFAKLAKERIKGADIACRFGGDEFAILYPATTCAGATAVTEQLRKAVEGVRVQAPANDDTPIEFSISAGIAQANGGLSPEEMLARADAALYRSKLAGRNRVTAG